MAGLTKMLTLLALLLSSPFLLRSVDASSITSLSSCYTVDQAFTFSFVDSTPLATDLIGVSRVGKSSVILLSVSICGSSGCTSKTPSSGTVSVAQSLGVGQYKPVLTRQSGSIMATSTTFTVSSSCGGTAAPTKRPTTTATVRPTTLPASAAPTKFTVNGAAQQILTQAKAAITTLIQNDARLIPEFLRMGFHDCVGGCDGCIDLSDPDNNGLLHPILALQPVVAQFENKNLRVSRADIWSLAAMTAADVAPHGSPSQPVSFNNKWFGRVNCEDVNTVCRNNAGQVVTCTPTTGPGRIMASPNFDSQGVFNYFATNFGFNQRQTVAIMGAHSVGRLVQSESGINGPNGWALHHDTLRNEYYNALMGAATAFTPTSQITSVSPDWTRKFTDNTGIAGMPNRNTWSLTAQGLPLVMLNSDIALARTLDSTNANTQTGAISCAFTVATANGSPVCPVAATINFVAAFSDNNDIWMNEFAAVLDLMLTAGYNRLSCSDAVCPLTRK